MTASGILQIANVAPYEDLESLKKYLKSIKNTPNNIFGYEINSIKQVGVGLAQAGTGSYVELELKGGFAIEDISAEGALYAWEDADVSGDREKVVTLEYLDASGNIKTAYATLDNTDTTTAAQFKDADDVNIDDFYRRRQISFEQVSGANIAIGNSGKTKIYGAIASGNFWSIHTRYKCPVNNLCWLALDDFNLNSSVDTYLKLTFTPYGAIDEVEQIIPFNKYNQGRATEPVVLLNPLSEVKWEILGNAANTYFVVAIVEAELKV